MKQNRTRDGITVKTTAQAGNLLVLLMIAVLLVLLLLAVPASKLDRGRSMAESVSRSSSLDELTGPLGPIVSHVDEKGACTPQHISLVL